MNHFIVLQRIQGLGQSPWQDSDGPLIQIMLLEMVDIFVDWGRRNEITLDPIQPGRQHSREGKVGIGTRIRTAKFDAGGRGLRSGGRHADKRRAIELRPTDVDWGLIARCQPLIAVDGWSHHGRQRPCMLHLPGYEIASQPR